MTSELLPIEAVLRAEGPPDDTLLIVRGGPMSAEKILEHAQREQAVYSFGRTPLASISADATVGDWTVERVLRERPWSRNSYATATAGQLRSAGFELLPTFQAPHYDVVLPAATLKVATTLVSVFGAAQRNLYLRRR